MKAENTQILDSGNLLVTIEVDLKCRGNGKQIIIPDEDNEDRSRQAFLVAVARGRKWQQALDDGTVADSRQIAALIGRDSSYVNRLIRLSLIAPQIIERVIKGEMPVTLSANRARKALPELWSDQVHEFYRD